MSHRIPAGVGIALALTYAEAVRLDALARDPKWEEFDREPVHVHDWRSHVPDRVREAWASLPVEAQIVAILMAEPLAAAENWE